MTRHKRSDDWGFPRWRSYGDKGRNAARVRLCDREGCSEIGDRPAPKAPNSPERWMFCEAHAAEYNKNWNFYAGMSEAQIRAQQESERMTGGRPTWSFKADANSREAAAQAAGLGETAAQPLDDGAARVELDDAAHALEQRAFERRAGEPDAAETGEDLFGGQALPPEWAELTLNRRDVPTRHRSTQP